MAIPDWVREWSQSTDHEVDSVHPAPPEDLRRAVVADTSSSDEELLAFRRSLHSLQPQPPSAAPRWSAHIGAPMALAATALLLLPAAEPEADLGQVHLQAGELHTIGDAVSLSGMGTLEVVEAHPLGGTVRLSHGMARFEVGAAADLEVLAAGITIEPMGGAASFDVQTFDEVLHVDVRAGSLLVSGGIDDHRLGAGERWSNALAVAATNFVPPDPLVVEEGATWIAPAPSPAVADVAEIDQVPATDSVPPADTPPAPRVSGPARAPRPSPQLALELAEVMTEWERGTDDPDALYARLTTLLAENPDSRVDAELRALRIEVGQEVIEPMQIIRNIDLFLAMYPAYPSRLSMLWMRATVARDKLQDCRRALPTYRRLAEEDSGRGAIEARAWQGLCAMEIGETGEAIRALGLAQDAGLGGDLGNEVARALQQLDVSP